VLLLRDLSTGHVIVSPAGGQSDHSLIVGHIELPLPHRYDTVMRRTRCWRSFNIDAYMQDVSASSLVQSPPSDVDELFDAYNSTLLSLLDRHAPVRLRPVSVRQSEPWLDADCRAAKRKTVVYGDWFNGPVVHLKNFKRLCMGGQSIPMFSIKYSRQLVADCYKSFTLLYSNSS